MIFKKNVLALVVLVVIVLGASFIFLSSFDTRPEVHAAATSDVTEQNEAANLLYGLPVAGFNIETNAVKRNEFLSDILQRYQVDLPSISILADKSKSVFDVRKIGAGHDYTVFADN